MRKMTNHKKDELSDKVKKFFATVESILKTNNKHNKSKQKTHKS